MTFLHDASFLGNLTEMSPHWNADLFTIFLVSGLCTERVRGRPVLTEDLGPTAHSHSRIPPAPNFSHWRQLGQPPNSSDLFPIASHLVLSEKCSEAVWVLESSGMFFNKSVNTMRMYEPRRYHNTGKRMLSLTVPCTHLPPTAQQAFYWETECSRFCHWLPQPSEDSPIGKEMKAKTSLNLTVLCVFITFWSETSVFA